MNARKPLVGGREPHLCSRPFELELRPSKPRANRDAPPSLLSNLTTGTGSTVSGRPYSLRTHKQGDRPVGKSILLIKLILA